MADRSFDPHRFHSTVPFYARYRVPYPAELIAFVADHVALPAGGAVLDLGTGPGLLATAFAGLGFRVTAMDPEPAMLEAAGQYAAEAGVTVALLRGSSFDLDPTAGSFDLVTMGRSFHWMDRQATLATLDRMVTPTGAVVLFGDRRIPSPGQDWRAVIEALVETYAPDAIRDRRRRRTEARHETVLAASAFSRLEHYGIVVSRTVDIDAVVGRTLSMSGTSPAVLGDRREAFEAELRRALAALSPTGTFQELVETKALIARRPAHSP
ncbi:class I SAM-dependent methyltransferase [Chelatococcus sp. GCM10030263]|uniref:class I SAM-dependent methyltransferase n=1 Tax=Chelatococcus sp. GCM10030263 TaxID=3273387 RepID=UPI00361A4B47